MLAGQPLRRPLIGIALSLVLGIHLASCGMLSVGLALVLACGALAVGFLKINSPAGSIAVFVAILAAGALRFLVANADLTPKAVVHMADMLPLSNVEVVGSVAGEPRYYPFKEDDRGMWMFPVRIEGLKLDGDDGWRTADGLVDARVMGVTMDRPSAQNRQRVWLRGKLETRDYRGGNPIGLKVSWPRYCKTLSSPRKSPLDWCVQWRESVAQRLSAGIADFPVQHAILRSLVLGYRNEIPDDTYDLFRRTGSLHIFAISGLHVGIVGLLLVTLLKSAGVPRDWFGVYLIPLLVVYVVATGLKASALRATLMAGVFMLAPLFRRRPDIPSSVSFAAIVLLLANPHELQNAGFVFSFVVVAFIVMVYSAIPARLLSGGWFRNYVFSLCVTSFAASLASIPMGAFYFGRFSPISLIANLSVVPLTFCIVLTGWLSILAPALSAVFNFASVAFINAMVWSVDVLDKIPGSSLDIKKPSSISIVLWYASLVYLLVQAKAMRERFAAVGGLFVSIVLAFIL